MRAAIKILVICALCLLKKSEAIAQRGYILIFTCCFETDLVIVKNGDSIINSAVVNTEASTSIASPQFFLKAERRLNVVIELVNKDLRLKIKLPKLAERQIRFLYVYFTDRKWSYKILKKLLRAY